MKQRKRFGNIALIIASLIFISVFLWNTADPIFSGLSVSAEVDTADDTNSTGETPSGDNGDASSGSNGDTSDGSGGDAPTGGNGDASGGDSGDTPSGDNGDTSGGDTGDTPSDDNGDTPSDDSGDDTGDDTDNGDEEPLTEVKINSSQDLIDYANNYALDPAQYQHIDVNVALTSGDLSDLYDFTSIGTPEYPFAASLIIAKSTDMSITLDKPLFAYIYDSAKMIDSENNAADITILRSGVGDSAAFAENVIHDPTFGGSAEWNIYIGTDGIDWESCSFSAIIGTLGEEADVKLSFENISGMSAEISSGGDAGLVCGTMEKSSKLTVSTANSGSYNVSSVGGNAGGLVGTMKESSKLELESGFSFSGNVSSGSYAGGLVGSAENAAVSFGDNAAVSGTVNGGSATGGIFGYYRSSFAQNDFDAAKYNVNCTLNGENSGGIFGVLENGGNMTVIGSADGMISSYRTSTSSSKGVYGGVIGRYSSDDLSGSLTLSGLSSSVDLTSGKTGNYSGVIGYVNCAAYIKFENISVSAAGCTGNDVWFGGILGHSEKAFIDAENITVDTNGELRGGGLIENMKSGVLRISGKTDFSNSTTVSYGGQIVGTRGDKTLIYAKDGWKFVRSTVPSSYDDIGNWGEVIRLSAALDESDILNVDETAHTVTVKGASTSISSLADFAALALNIQLNDGTSSVGALYFENTYNTSSRLLSSAISINCDIDLKGTGITGLTRDDGYSAGGADVAFTGTISGSGHTVTLAAGEPYGIRGGTDIAAFDTTEGNGCIQRHYYNALLAKTGSGAQFKDITVDGFINVNSRDNKKYYIGALSGLHTKGSFTAENVSVRTRISYRGTNTDYSFAGGFAGRVDDNAVPVIKISGCVVSPEISYTDSNHFLICGGAFGEISSTSSMSVNADDVTIGAVITNNSSNTIKKAGGFIGNISNYNGDPQTRTVLLKNIVVDGAQITSSLSGSTAESGLGGALIGESWNNVDVAIGSETESGIMVKNSSVIQNGTSGFAGLFSAATGFWKVYDINISSLKVIGGNAGSFGMVVNRGVHTDYSRTYALYLEFEKENALRITSADMSGLNSSAIYDDIIATCSGSYTDETAVLQNGKCAVVSIHTSGGTLLMNGTDCNTYQDQTSVKGADPYSRYYYNLDVIRAKSTASLTAPEKLMLWSVNRYAYQNIKQYFTDSFGSTIPAGNYDMTGYSFYPIDAPAYITIAGKSSFVFSNDEIENSELGTGNTDGQARKTAGEKTEHYLMHCGLFINAYRSISITNAEFSGSVGGDTEYSGAFICGTLSGSNTETAKTNISGIVLGGISVNGDASYAPLLINKIGSYTELTASGISTTESYKTNGITTAATSLIGDVGSSDGTSVDIKLNFSKLTLDGRKNALSDSAANSSLTAAYKTDSSVFSKAVLLNSFRFKAGSNCSGTYNFKFSEDWNDDGSGKHNVAYGSEISDSGEYDGLQERYLKSDTFTDPTTPEPDSEYTFKTEFLPYVAKAYDNTNNFHEIKVNQSVQADLDVGCGTYNDPYIISYGRQLELLDKILGGNLGAGEDGTVINYKKDNYKVNCPEKNSHSVLIWNASDNIFKSEDGKTSVSAADMQKALATAYFQLSENVSITSAEFLGIGKKIPFKGVIDGNGKDLELGSTNPLIYNSVGSVVKDLNVDVTADFTGLFSTDADSLYETDGSGTTVFYGGIFGIVNGGDNIIDNVGVTFENADTININVGTKPGNKAVGGYIGVVRYGGVIFRNMDNAAHDGITSNDNPLFGSTVSNGKIFLYCNPVIGRVIDGYAVTEADSFKGSESSVTMKNGTKNYSISDIDKNGGKITFGAFENPTASVNSSTVYITDAQQLFLLGCISMSGEGSADYNGSYPTTYSFGKDQMSRHANYDAVGTDDAADFDLAAADGYERTAVPYIIYKYTQHSSSGAAYPAKSITNNKFAFSIDLAQGRYELPDGFRGIGSMSRFSDDLIMYINGINGNGSQIVLNMRFNMYKNDYDKYYNVNATSAQNQKYYRNYRVGLGLFNTLIQNNSGFTPADFADDTSGKYTISNLTFSGTVDHTTYTSESNTTQHTDKDYLGCAGALAGASYSSELRTENVIMSDLTVNSYSAAGGLLGAAIGSSGNNSLTITDFSASGLSVNGTMFAGGLIGYSKDCVLEAVGGTRNSSFDFDAVSLRQNISNGYDFSFGAGGLIGTYVSSDKNITTSAEIKNIDFGAGRVFAAPNQSFVGGIIGCVGEKSGNNNVSLVAIKNVDLNGTTINNGVNSTSYSGGVIGVAKESTTKVEMTDVHLNGTSGQSVIQGYSEAGGLIGLLLGSFSADDCTISGYTVSAAGQAEAAGGFIAKSESVSGKKLTRITNCVLADCIVKQSRNKPIGGIVGISTNGMNIYGYNIVMDNVRLTDPNGGSMISTVAGDIEGQLKSGGELKLVGVSIRRTASGAGKNIGRNEGTSYVIFSDFGMDCLDTASANKEPSNINGANNVDDMGSFPYATVNPKTVIDSSGASPKFMTGNGADKSVVDSILGSFGGINGYNNAFGEYTDVFSHYKANLSTFNSKTGASIPNDFPVLVINDSDYRNTTAMLNSYIHILTNDTTITNYAQADSKICSVDIIPFRLKDDGSAFETSDDFEQTLYFRNGYFRMTDLDYDSNYKQFSVIDIRYTDPSDTSRTAYHLYIPVYVEKMLEFDFSAAALSGTNYNRDLYTDGHPVIENYGTPVTAYITYQYKRGVTEWQNVINSGENLLKGYGKTVLLNSKNDLPADTKLVIVDRNNNSKAYYSTIGEAFSSASKKLDFSKFKDSDGNSFVPISFCELLENAADISVSPDENGTLIKCTADNISDAVFKVGDDYYRKKTDSDTDTSLLCSVSLTPKSGMVDASTGFLKVVEDYYISFFTQADNDAPMRNITLACNARLGDTNMTPSHLDNANAKEAMVHMILGNLYDQTFTFKTTGSEVMNESNRSLYGELKTVISLKPENAVEVKPYLNDESIHLYHGFVIEAARTDEDGTAKGIKGDPRVTGTYKVGSSEYPFNFTNSDSIITLTGGPSGISADIKSMLINSSSVTIFCDDLVITYSDGESIIAQFPERKGQGDTFGVTLSAASNLAYMPDNIGYSNMSENKNDASGKSYYRENIAAATLSYNIPQITPNELAKLGINGRELNEKITAVGYYNVMNLSELQLNSAKTIKFTLSLYRKNNSGIYEQVDPEEYLSGLELYDKNGNKKLHTVINDSYEYYFDKNSELNFEAGSFEVVSDFSVITGAAFEDGGKLYSNYKLQLTAMLLDRSGDPIESSGCNDYIIYTNAKIDPQMQLS